MDAAQFHALVAELSMALAGFSGLVVGLKSRETGIVQQDRIGLVNILIASGVTMLFALAPEALMFAGLEAPLAVRLSNGALALTMVATVVLLAMAARRSPPRYPVLFWGFLGVGLVLAPPVLLTAIGLLTLAGDLGALALLWLLAGGMTQFFVFLLESWWRPATDARPRPGTEVP